MKSKVLSLAMMVVLSITFVMFNPATADAEERGRFRVTLVGLFVNHETWDDALQADGRGDEVFALVNFAEIWSSNRIWFRSSPAIRSQARRDHDDRQRCRNQDYHGPCFDGVVRTALYHEHQPTLVRPQPQWPRHLPPITCLLQQPRHTDIAADDLFADV
jgi:hypothetical protein